MMIRIFFAWYDFWVGAYFDRAKRTLYICPVPTFVIAIQLPLPEVDIVKGKTAMMEVEIVSQWYCGECETPLDYEDQECPICYREDRIEQLVADKQRLQAALSQLLVAARSLRDQSHEAMMCMFCGCEYETFTDPEQHASGCPVVTLTAAIATVEGEGDSMKPNAGIYGKYIIQKADGSPVDPQAVYFVLRLDTDLAARSAALTYACDTPNTKLADDVRRLVGNALLRHNPSGEGIV